MFRYENQEQVVFAEFEKVLLEHRSRPFVERVLVILILYHSRFIEPSMVGFIVEGSGGFTFYSRMPERPSFRIVARYYEILCWILITILTSHIFRDGWIGFIVHSEII